MSYDCAIATRNRINALRASIPLILKQDVLPRRLIIVDASDDHESVSTELYEISERLGFKNTVVVKSDSVNSARQRNIGLQLVEAPIVMMPDDDSMWHAGFASRVLKIYEADVRRQVRRRYGRRRSCAAPGIGTTHLQEERIREREGGAATLSNFYRKSFLPKTF